MSEELKQKLEEFYREFLVMPKAVTEIFNDFYDEERVDLQPITFEEFVIFLEYNSLYEIAGGISSFLNGVYMRSHENAELIEEFKRDYSLNHYLVESVDTFERYAPYMKEFVGNRFFNDIDIIIHFPHVTITNEYDRRVEVNNLWAKVPITWEGKGRGWFKMNRSEYSLLHMQSDYMHSHVAGIDLSDFAFRSVCTGSGPINSTLSSLTVEFDAALWQLFCLELERYMGTESIAGVPYRKMEEIGSNNRNKIASFLPLEVNFSHRSTGVISIKFFENFFKYLFKSNTLRYNYVNGSYGIAASFTDTVLFISNAFITWYNAEFKKTPSLPSLESLKEIGVIRDAIIVNGSIHTPLSDVDRDYSQYEGRKVLTFKGKDVNLTITGLLDEKLNTSLILSVGVVREIVWVITELLNCEYGNSKKTNSGIDKKKTRFTL